VGADEPGHPYTCSRPTASLKAPSPFQFHRLRRSRCAIRLSRWSTTIVVVGPGEILAQILFEIADQFPSPQGRIETGFTCGSASEQRAGTSPLKQIPEFHLLTPCVRYKAKLFTLIMDS